MRPPRRRRPPDIIRYAVTTHWSWPLSRLNERPMDGRAVLTTEMSRTTKIWAASATASSTHDLRSSISVPDAGCDAVLGCDAGWPDMVTPSRSGFGPASDLLVEQAPPTFAAVRHGRPGQMAGFDLPKRPTSPADVLGGRVGRTGLVDGHVRRVRQA
jgi:hypothetical protein